MQIKTITKTIVETTLKQALENFILKARADRLCNQPGSSANIIIAQLCKELDQGTDYEFIKSKIDELVALYPKYMSADTLNSLEILDKVADAIIVKQRNSFVKIGAALGLLAVGFGLGRCTATSPEPKQKNDIHIPAVHSKTQDSSPKLYSANFAQRKGGDDAIREYNAVKNRS